MQERLDDYSTEESSLLSGCACPAWAVAASAGAVVTFTFGGINYNTTPIQGVFQRVTLRDIVLGLANGEGAVVFNSNAGTNADVNTPEPASVATLGAGLGLLLVLAGRRHRRA